MPIESTKQLYDFVFKRLEVYTERERRSITEIVLEYFLDVNRTQILIDAPIEPPSEEFKRDLKNVCKRINSLEPVQYILGETQFYGFNFFVNPSVLIPRPETEELVDQIQKNFKIEDAPKIIDIGTGSGCIAISLAQLLPNSEVSAIEISEEAVKVATDNIVENEVSVQLFCGDILIEDLPNQDYYDVIVSNPPYITEKEKEIMDPNVLNFEPHLALFIPNNEPLKFYMRIAELGLKGLKKDGKLYFEINENYAQETIEMLRTKGYQSINVIKDLQDKDRIVIASLA